MVLSQIKCLVSRLVPQWYHNLFEVVSLKTHET